MIKYVPKPKFETPPGPASKGLMGNTKAFVNERFEMMRHCTEDYDGIVFVRIAFKNVYIVSKPEFVAHVLQKNAKNYHKSANYDGLKPMLGEGLLTNEGDSWFRQRRLMQPAFMKERLASMIKVMAERTDEAIAKWETEFKGQFFDIGHEMRLIASDIVTRALFSTVDKDQTEEVGTHLKVLLQYANDKIVNPFKLPLHYPTKENKLIRSSIEALDTIIGAIITERRSKQDVRHDDLLQILIEAEDTDTGERMNDKQLRDELMTLYLAGQETTQHALTFCLRLLALHPQTLKTAQAEAKSVLTESAPDLATVQQLQYTKQVINEGMRLFPPIWAVSRRAVNDDEIGGYKIPKNSTVFVPIWAIHRHASIWHNGNNFDPDRFTPEHERLIPKNTFFPFGAGPRICIGNHFAMLEMQVVLANILQKFTPELQDSGELELVTNMTMRPAGAVMMRMV